MRRRRVGLFSLEEYESAKASFEAAHALEARRETATWIRKCDAELQGAPAAVSSCLPSGPRDCAPLSSTCCRSSPSALAHCLLTVVLMPLQQHSARCGKHRCCA